MLTLPCRLLLPLGLQRTLLLLVLSLLLLLLLLLLLILLSSPARPQLCCCHQVALHCQLLQLLQLTQPGGLCLHQLSWH
jgi:hypothetical protein